MNNPKGSIWRKWDLHLHTPSSYDYENKSKSNQEIIDTLKANNIAAVAITDHHVIDTTRIKELQALAKDEVTIFPGIELRSELGGSESIHFIGIFPEDCDIDDVWTKLQGPLEITPKNVTEKGDDKIYCDLKDAAEIIHKLGGLVSIHAGSKSNTVENITNALPHKEATKEDIVKSINIYEIGKVADVIDYEENVFPDIDEYIAMVICSDNHNIDDYKLKCNFWIKANPTFEGLRQITYEPQGRVRIQDEEPEQKTDYLVIDKVKYINQTDDKTFHDIQIELNSHLNSIIGGKSAGKSLLLYNIAKTIDPIQSNEKIKFCQLTDVLDRNSSHNFEVHWKDGQIDKLSDDTSEKRRNITYVPQMYINRLVEEKEEGSLNKLILDVLLQHDDFKSLHQITTERIRLNSNDINSSILELFAIIDSHRQTKEELSELGDKSAITIEVGKIKTAITKLKDKSGFTEEENRLYEDIIKEKDKKEKEIIRLKSLLENVNEFKVYLTELPASIAYDIQVKVDEIKENIFENEEAIKLIDKIHETIDRGLRESLEKNISSEFEIIKTYDKKLKKSKKELSDIEEKLKPYLIKFKNQDFLKTLQNALIEQSKLLVKISEHGKNLKKHKENYQKIKSKILEIYQSLYDCYISIVTILKEEKYKIITNDIELKAELSFNIYNFEKQFSEILDKRLNLNEISSLWNEKNEFVFSTNSHIAEIQKTFNKLLDGNVILRSGQSIKDATIKLLNDYFFIKYDLIHKNDTITQMSPGKRGLVLLQLIMHLSNAKHPILLDQPEDNLDNRTVFKELNDFVKKKKVERQIIMVTHNANLVVSTDAEEIIVANQDGQQVGRDNKEFKFEYISGALENSFENSSEQGILYQKGIKEHVCEILEGGEEAFKKRQEKYAFNH